MPLIDPLRGRRHAALRRSADEELIALARRGDALAFEVIFDRHSPSAYSLAHRMCGERELAEDVVQETFISLWRGVGNFQASRGSLRSWLLTSVRNRMIDAFRTRTAKQSGDVADDGIAERLAGLTDVHAEVSAREQRLVVHEALGTLPDDQRRVIELAFFGGLSHSQIASMLELPAGTVKGRMRLGLAKLRDSLGPRVETVI